MLQAAVYEGKLARVPDAAFKTTALGVGTLEMMQMLDQTPLGYQTKDFGNLLEPDSGVKQAKPMTKVLY